MAQFIIVTGMAHSGTTILTRTLSQHPDIDLLIGGGEAWLYENNALLHSDMGPVNEFQKNSKKDFILMKRPWVYHNKDFLMKNFPNAHYLYIQRNKKEIFESWAKDTGMVEHAAKVNTDHQHKKYEESIKYSIDLEVSVKSFLRIQHKELCENPELIFNNIVEKIGLNNFRFNLREIKEKVDIKRLLRQHTGVGFPVGYKYMM